MSAPRITDLGPDRTEERKLEAEIDRLRAALQTANANHERFEREWYLRGDEIERLCARVAELEEVLVDLLDDMGDGRSVSQAAKDQARAALESKP